MNTKKADNKNRASVGIGSGFRAGRRNPTFIERARRKQILTAATELFAKNGFDQTSLAEIARAVDVSKGVISYHFNGKRDLGEAVIRNGLREYGQYVRGRVARKSKALDQLLEFVDACLDFISQHDDFYMTYLDVQGCFGTAEEKRAMLSFVNGRTREILVNTINLAKREGDVRKGVSTRSLADVIQAMIDGIQEQIAADPGLVDVPGCKRVCKAMIRQHVAP